MRKSRSVDAATLAVEIATLGDLDQPGLKRRWIEIVGTPPPKFMRKDLLARAIAFRLQERALCGLQASLRRRLDAAADEVAATGSVRVRPVHHLKPGTRLVREWRGTVHEVLAVPEGFAWNGERHRSLSKIAHAITGTRWNGWVFFGVIRPDKAVRRATKAVPGSVTDAVAGLAHA
jgi:DUF2924 family protein